MHYQTFVLFGRSHLTVLALTIVVPLALAFLVRRAQSRLLAQFICRFFAAAIGGIWVVWYIVFYRNGWLDPGNVLPMDLCSWAAITTLIALLRPNQKSV